MPKFGWENNYHLHESPFNICELIKQKIHWNKWNQISWMIDVVDVVMLCLCVLPGLVVVEYTPIAVIAVKT